MVNIDIKYIIRMLLYAFDEVSDARNVSLNRALQFLRQQHWLACSLRINRIRTHNSYLM